MSKEFLDLTPIFNYRLVYPKNTKLSKKKEIGISNIFLTEESFKFNTVINHDMVSCLFKRNKRGFDNVRCDSQKLITNKILVKKITIIGFCCWGYYKEKLILQCEDEDVEVYAYFSDTSWLLSTLFEYSFNIEKNIYDAACHILCEVEWSDHKGFMYYYTTEFDQAKIVNKIIFPDNYLMHIFAITIEN